MSSTTDEGAWGRRAPQPGGGGAGGAGAADRPWAERGRVPPATGAGDDGGATGPRQPLTRYGEATQQGILATARSVFARVGYQRGTLRLIAREAGVDPALLIHYFGSKRVLFASAVRLPFDPAERIPAVLAGDPAGRGERLAAFAVGIWEDRATQPRLLGVLRAATSDPDAAAILRETTLGRLVDAVAGAIGGPDADLRAACAVSQVMGMAMARHVVRAPVLADADPEELVARLARGLQALLGDETDDTTRPDGRGR